MIGREWERRKAWSGPVLIRRGPDFKESRRIEPEGEDEFRLHYAKCEALYVPKMPKIFFSCEVLRDAEMYSIQRRANFQRLKRSRWEFGRAESGGDGWVAHLFPSRTQKLSTHTPKVLGWRRPGRLGSCRFIAGRFVRL